MSPGTICDTLARLWDTGANAYELAQAVMLAADIKALTWSSKLRASSPSP